MLTNNIELPILILINAFSVFLIIIVLAYSFRDRLYSWFVLMTFLLTGWVDFSYLGYVSQNATQAVTFYRFNLAFVAAFFFAAYVFYVEKFLKVNKSILRGGLLILSSLFFVCSLFTNTIIYGVIDRDWGNEITFGTLNPYFDLFSVAVASIFIYYFISRFPKLSESERAKVRYFLVGTSLLILFNLVFNVLSPVILHTARYQHIGDYSAIVFLAFTAYAILRNKFLGIKVAFSALLISTIGLLLLVDIFALSNGLLQQEVKSLVFMLFVGFSVALIRSVLNEIKQKEELEKANKSLGKAYQELEKTNQALNESRQSYIELTRQQKDIINVMAHEVRTPLTIIGQQMAAQEKHVLPTGGIMLEEVKNLPTTSKFLPLMLEALHTSGQAITQAMFIVNTMLEAARLDKGAFTLSYSSFDLVAAIREGVELIAKSLKEDQAGKYRIRFVEPEFNNLEVEADRGRLIEAVQNLVNNAMKYTDPTKEMAAIDVSVSQHDGRALIEVADNGMGIAAEDLEKLGKIFLRLDPKTEHGLPHPDDGAGVGLFMIKGIIEHHEGRLLIRSEGWGKGSVFSLEFPVKRPH